MHVLLRYSVDISDSIILIKALSNGKMNVSDNPPIDSPPFTECSFLKVRAVGTPSSTFSGMK